MFGLILGSLVATCLSAESLAECVSSRVFCVMEGCLGIFLKENGFLFDAGLANEKSETSAPELSGR